MYWQIGDFFQPSPIEQILDKEEYTLEELLNEQDIIQECKSLNGRLVAFLRERSTVEQLIRYLVEPASDLDDPKRTYKYPFTACEVLCCEVEAIFVTLLEDNDLLRLLFSILDNEPPLSSKTAGYFGRVVSHLLLRKPNELLQYIQENAVLLEKLIKHVDTTSIADVIKRLVGADEQPGTLCISAFAHWLVDTPIVELLLGCLSIECPSEVQTNAADILSAIAYTQPSPLATLLANEDCIFTLFHHILQKGRRVFIPLIDICVALVESKRDFNFWDNCSLQDTAKKVKTEAAAAIAQHLPPLVDMLRARSVSAATGPSGVDAVAALEQEAANNAADDAAGGAIRTLAPPPEVVEYQYGMLSPRIGRFCLKIVKLIAVLLLHNTEECTEQSILTSGAVEECLKLFAAYPFNNVLHDSVTAIIAAAFIRPEGSELLPFLIHSCKLVDWLTNLPSEVTPIPGPGKDRTGKPRLRAGYMGHVIRIGTLLEQMCMAANDADLPVSTDGSLESGVGGGGLKSMQQQSFVDNLQSHPGWQRWCDAVLHPRLEVENLAHWSCGRPVIALPPSKNDDDDFQPALFHRYQPVEDNNEDLYENLHSLYHSSYNAELVTEELAVMELHDPSLGEGDQDELGEGDAEGDEHTESGGANEAPIPEANDDDEVLLATSDEEEDDDEGGPVALADSSAATAAAAAEERSDDEDDEEPAGGYSNYPTEAESLFLNGGGAGSPSAHAVNVDGADIDAAAEDEHSDEYADMRTASPVPAVEERDEEASAGQAETGEEEASVTKETGGHGAEEEAADVSADVPVDETPSEAVLAADEVPGATVKSEDQEDAAKVEVEDGDKPTPSVEG